MYAGAQVSVSEARPEGNAKMDVCPGRVPIAGSIFPRAWEACALKRSERANVASSESACSNFKVLPPDPHGFDGDDDGIGCES